MIIQEVLINYLKANAGVLAKVADRIHYIQAPQNSTTPYIVLTTIGTNDTGTLTAPSGLVRQQIQLMVVADDVLTMVDTMQALHTALSAWPMVASVSSVSYSIQAATRENLNDFFDDDTKQYYSVARYDFFYHA